MSEPVYCNPRAFAFLQRQMPHVETTRGLLMASVGVAMHALPDVDPDWVDHRIGELGRKVLRRVRSGQRRALVAHLHDVLFEQEGFTGNVADYSNPCNSYVPLVLKDHQGLPITLSLIYKCVAERVGLEVYGVNAPAHFLAAVRMDEELMYIDPFYAGRVMSRQEVVDRIEQIARGPIQRTEEMLAPATHRQWLYRILQNLLNIFHVRGESENLSAMHELRRLL